MAKEKLIMGKIISGILFVGALLLMSKAFFLNAYPDFGAYYNGSFGNNILNYPPFVTIIFSVFSIFPIVIASKIWLAISISSLLLSLYLCFKLFKIRILSSLALILSSLVFVYFPVRFTLGMGQLNLLVLLFVVLTFYFYIKDKDAYSGICLGISIMLKLFPVLIILYFLVLKRFKILLYTLLTFAGLSLVSYFFIKPEINNNYWLHLLPVLTSTPVDYYNQALSGFLAREIHNYFFRDLSRIIISIFLVLFSFWLILRNKKADFSKKTLEFGFLITLNILINGYSWQHHFSWLVLPFLTVFFYIRSKNIGMWSYLLLGTSYLLTCANLKNFVVYPALIQSHVFFGALLLWGMAGFLLFRNA